MSQERSWCYGRPIGSENRRSEEEYESRINIITPVDIWQIGFANGGNGGTVTNTAVVTTVNVIVFSGNETGTTPGLTIGTGNRNIDISADENGTFVNGQKIDETALDDGTKVFVFRDSEVKK